ncbi:MAG: tetratricopeptide repeat protein, partial [Candidatus Zixiibacteriota bacterium]
MSGCSDKKFEKMLHAYELGMLSESEREELELHLMDCEYCFRQVQQFEKAGTLLRDDPEVRSTLVEITEKSDNRPSPVSEMKPVSKRKYWPTLVPVSIAAVIVFFFLVLKDWNIQLQPSQEAVASTNRLAIMYFDQLNRTDSTADLSDIITSLLITDLSESQYLEVVSSQRLYDILKLMGKEGLKNIDKNIATEVAEKARARWILTGDIIELANKITITAQLVEMESGQSIASQKVTGDSLKTIFELVDELSAEIKRDLPLPMAAFEEPDRQIADVTTHSREAYQLYLEGKELYNKFYSTEAREKFEQALAYDSTFAMAYHELAYLKDARLIDKAMQYINHASQKEKFYIRSTKAMASKNMNQGIAELEMLLDRYPDEKEAMYKLGRYKYNLGLLDESESYFNRAIEIDPLYKVAYNNLAYTYQAQGNFEKALWAINQYIALAPDEANPYDTRG